jgi:alginate O-acetyltransferase complex protein AlgI
MLFNSIEFLFFLPIVLIGFFLLSKLHNELFSRLWLIFASLFFYGWWESQYLFLIIISMFFNYTLGATLSRYRHRQYIIFGILMNLILLGYYKYSNFFVDNFNLISGNHYHLEKVILPLAISFFTFQQIAYLVDSYKGQIKEYNFFNYCLFVTFFPQLIAGPIVHHKEMLPQFSNKQSRILKAENISVGLTIFMIGMFKKVVIADNIATFSTPVFNAAQAGETVTFFEAWLAAFCYSFQLYFDFSGYSDMAIGAARMFGIKLPLNFHSPYKAVNIIEFWRRWHITLSRFMKDYVYIPLGGNQTGAARKYIYLTITMLLAGLWHGAGWNSLSGGYFIAFISSLITSGDGYVFR